jgi:tetratricopeptide (TPR) repeat protein
LKLNLYSFQYFRSVLIAFAILLPNLLTAIQAQTPADPEIKEQIEIGIEKTILNDFSGAAVLFQQLIDQYPEQPFGYFYLGATYQAVMLDAESYNTVEEFKQLMEKCIVLAEAQQKENPENIWAYFFEGSAYLYKSFMDSKMKKIWGAYRNAAKGSGRLEKVIELDSSFYDAYLGVGSYKYWKSSKGKFLTWLPILKDERETGIEMIRTALQKGNFVRLIGRDQLAWILLDNDKGEEALALAKENHYLYPESRFFLWTSVEIYYCNGQWDEAFALYEKLLQIVRRLPDNNHYNEITCLLRMAEIYYDKGDYANTEVFASEVLRLKLSEEVRERVKTKLKKALKLKQDCLTELAKLDKMTQ